MKRRAILAAAGLLILATAALAGEGRKIYEEDSVLPPWLPEFHVDFRTLFLWQNDSDFDDTRPLYSEYGQTVGYVSTLLRPRLVWKPVPEVQVVYEIEVGDNIWSRNDANQGDPTGEGRPIFRHRQFWGSFQIPQIPVWLTSGYRYFHDPTHLVADRYVGAADITGRWKSGQVAGGAAVIPDTVYEGRDPNDEAFDPDLEGFDPQRNNFENDDFFFFLAAEQQIGEGLTLAPGAYLRWDKTEIRRPRWVLSPVVNLNWKLGEAARVGLDLAGQVGEFENGGIGNRDVDLLAGAGQLRIDLALALWRLQVGTLLFSADDGDRFDLRETGFQYSGLAKARTVILSQNWLQDQYNNLDERAAAQSAGLWLTDVQIGYQPFGAPMVFAIVGYGRVLEDRHLNHDPNLGWEADVGWAADLYGTLARLTLLGGAFFPGKAAAALVNEIDTRATEILWHAQAAMEIRF